MVVVRPVMRHFFWWLLFAPVVLFELHALDFWRDQQALTDSGRYEQATAIVLDYRASPRGTSIRYRFQPAGETGWYTASDLIGRNDLWMPLTPAAAQAARADNNRIRVRYLPEKPWINLPVGVAGNPVFDSLGSWVIFLIIDLFWVGDTFLMARNFLLAQVAAERQQLRQIRFWRTVLPNS